nr:hypothetical protein [Auraticoccus cholistanensis]
MAHRHAGQAAGERADPVLVDVHGEQVAAEPGQRDGEGAVARAQLEDGAVGLLDQGDDPADGGTVDREVLAELVAATGGGPGVHDVLRRSRWSTRGAVRA